MTNKYAEKRIIEPHLYYATPARVLADTRLQGREKLKVLQTMRMDAGYLAAATTAQLGGGRVPNLQRVESAIRALKQANGRNA